MLGSSSEVREIKNHEYNRANIIFMSWKKPRKILSLSEQIKEHPKERALPETTFKSH